MKKLSSPRWGYCQERCWYFHNKWKCYLNYYKFMKVQITKKLRKNSTPLGYCTLNPVWKTHTHTHTVRGGIVALAPDGGSLVGRSGWVGCGFKTNPGWSPRGGIGFYPPRPQKAWPLVGAGSLWRVTQDDGLQQEELLF
jgi:hypothetical protein